MDGQRRETRHGRLLSRADCSSVLPYDEASLRGRFEACQGSGPHVTVGLERLRYTTDIDEFALLAQFHRDRHAFFQRRER